MAASYTITDVDPRTNEWTAPDGGTVTYFRVNLDSYGDREVSVGRNLAKTAAPQVGDSLYGVVEETDRGLKFKSVKQGGFGGGRSPEDRRSIVRQHSQEMVLRREANLIASGKGGLTGEQLAQLIDWFEKDAA